MVYTVHVHSNSCAKSSIMAKKTLRNAAYSLTRNTFRASVLFRSQCAVWIRKSAVWELQLSSSHSRNKSGTTLIQKVTATNSLKRPLVYPERRTDAGFVSSRNDSIQMRPWRGSVSENSPCFFFHRIHLFLVLSYVTKPSVSCRYPAVKQTGDRLRLRCGSWKWNTIPQNPQSAFAKKPAAARRRAAVASAGSQTLSVNSTGLSAWQRNRNTPTPFSFSETWHQIWMFTESALPILWDFCRTALPAYRRRSFTVSLLYKKTSINEMALVKSRSRRVKLSLWVPAARQKTNARPSLSRIARELLKLPSFAWRISGEESRRLTEVAFVTGDNEISAPLHSVWLRVGIRFHRNLSLISFFFMVTTKSHKSNQFISDF